MSKRRRSERRNAVSREPEIVNRPIIPTIADASICRDIFIRAYAEPVGWNRRHRPRKRGEPPSLDGTVACIDTESVRHDLTFGVCDVYEEFGRAASFEALRPRTHVFFFRDDLPRTDPAGYRRLIDICNRLSVKLVSREWLFQNVIWPARKHGWIICGHNIVYDVSRLADCWAPATKTARHGAHFCNGFALIKSFPTDDGKPPPPFCRIKRDDRHHVRIEMRKAVAVDTQIADFAYTDCNHTLKKACGVWGNPFEDRPGAHSGEITLENVKGCLDDVEKTSQLLWTINAEHKRHAHRGHLSRMQSGAALAKSDLLALGVRPRLDVQPDFSKQRMGEAATTYFGGWVEATIGGLLPCVYLDFRSMFVTAHALLGLWSKHYTAARLIIEELPPQEVVERLARIRENPGLLFDPNTHGGLDFFALVYPNNATLPSRVSIPSESLRLFIGEERSAATDSVITIGPVSSTRPLCFAGPDLAHAAIRGGKPDVLRAWQLRPAGGLLDTLAPLHYRGEDVIDPRVDDFFVKLINLRVRETADPLDDKRRKTGYKVVALSGAYGIAAETNPIDIDPDDTARKPRRVKVFALEKEFEAPVDRPERPGPFNFFPTAALVTAEARLLLGLARHEIERRGGAVSYCDTDGALVVSTERGGFVPCDGGPYLLSDGTRAVRALSWKELEEVRQRFIPLGPYGPVAVPGSILKCEDENYALGANGKPDYSRREQLYGHIVSEKLYVLFNLDEHGEPRIRKYSSLVLGQLRSPIPIPPDGDPRAWIIEAWAREIRRQLGKPVQPFVWETYPAMEQLTMSTWNVFKNYQQQARPFDFLIVGIISSDLKDIAARPRRCCKEPRPSCLLFDDPAQWRSQKWRCLRCGAAWDFDTFPRLRTYGELVEKTLRKVDRKRLNADGSEPTRPMHGVTIPRPVRVESITPVGKEVIVDPTDTGEDFTAEMLSATPVQEYHDPGERLDALRAKVRAFGINRSSRISGVSRRVLQAFVNQGKTPHRSTLEKLEAALATAMP